MDPDEEASIAEDVLKLELHTTPLNLNWEESEDEDDDDDGSDADFTVEDVNIKDVNRFEDIFHDQPSTSKTVPSLDGSVVNGGTNHDGYSSEEDEELIDLSSEFSPTPFNLLKLNFAYQEVVEQQLALVEKLLQENHYKKSLIKENMERSLQQAGKRPRLEATLFNQMFFKDDQGFGPSNPDLDRIKVEIGPGFSANLLPPSKWKKSTDDALITGIESNSQRAVMEPLLTQLEHLQAKQKENDTSAIQSKIKEVKEKINDLKENPSNELMNDRFHRWDWESIANLSLDYQQTAVNCELHWKNYLHPSINHSPWTQEEDQKLTELVSKYKNHDWNLIAAELGTNRTVMDIVRRYQLKINSAFKSRTWTPEEDALLIKLVEKYRVGNVVPYTQIALQMKNRYSTQLVHRWTKSLDPTFKRTKFAPEEDAALVRAVSIHGEKWAKIRDLGLVPGRNDAQLRERYVNVWRASRKSSWSQKDDELLERLVGQFGESSWTVVAAHMKGRIDSQCSRRWLVLQRIKAQGGKLYYRTDTAKRKTLLKLRKKLRKAIFSEHGKESSNSINTTSHSDSTAGASTEDILRAYSITSQRKPDYVKKRPPKSPEEQQLDRDIMKLMCKQFQPMSVLAHKRGSTYYETVQRIRRQPIASKKDVFVRFVKALNINAEKTVETIRSKKMASLKEKNSNQKGATKRTDVAEHEMTSLSNGGVRAVGKKVMVSRAAGKKSFVRNLYLPVCAPNRATVDAYNNIYKDRESRVANAKKIVQLPEQDDDDGKFPAETLLADMRSSYKYKIFRSRFNALFTWPTLLASLVPYTRRGTGGGLQAAVRTKRRLQPTDEPQPSKRSKST